MEKRSQKNVHPKNSVHSDTCAHVRVSAGAAARAAQRGICEARTNPRAARLCAQAPTYTEGNTKFILKHGAAASGHRPSGVRSVRPQPAPLHRPVLACSVRLRRRPHGMNNILSAIPPDPCQKKSDLVRRSR